MQAELGSIETWAYGRNCWARAVPNDGRKPKTFGPQLCPKRVDELAEAYLRGEYL